MSLPEDPARLTRRAVLWIGLGGLAGCGFTPVYAPGGSAMALRNRVALEMPATIEGYDLRDRLEERLGRAEAAAYVLFAELTIERDAVAITPDGATTRFTLPGRADWTLRGVEDGATVAEGVAQAFVSYSATGSTVATQAAEEDARRRLSVILADRIVTRLLAAVGGAAQ